MRPDAENPAELAAGPRREQTDSILAEAGRSRQSLAMPAPPAPARAAPCVRDAAADVVVRKLDQLAIRANIKDAARAVVGGGAKAVAAAQEPGWADRAAESVVGVSGRGFRGAAPPSRVLHVLDRVDVVLMARKGLRALAHARVPDLGEGVATARDKGVGL